MWERTFCQDVLDRGKPLSFKQRQVVDGMMDKAKAYGRNFS